MDLKSTKLPFLSLLCMALQIAIVSTCIYFPALAQNPEKQEPLPSNAAVGSTARGFDTPQAAAEGLIQAADPYDVPALSQIFGPEAEGVIFTGEFPLDKKHADDFVAEAREKESVSIDPKTRARAFLLVGSEDWPFPVPIVKRGSRWFFDTRAGKQELHYRRIGANEIDAIEICRGYVEAQDQYALQPREGYGVNQYAQRIISTAGTQDGLAWQNADGSWGGPIGQKIAHAIEQGYPPGAEPYHGYFFKILKGQGPAAPLGRMHFVLKGVMIGGFALVASPAEYGVTGVRSFIVSHDGVVYEKDLGPETLKTFQRIEVFNPEKSWIPVKEQSQ